jgi:hypothetical protein
LFAAPLARNEVLDHGRQRETPGAVALMRAGHLHVALPDADRQTAPILMIVMINEAMTSPFTNFIAPSIAP